MNTIYFVVLMYYYMFSFSISKILLYLLTLNVIFEILLRGNVSQGYIVLIVFFFIFWASGILGSSDGKPNATKPVLRGVRVVALSISSHEQTQ